MRDGEDDLAINGFAAFFPEDYAKIGLLTKSFRGIQIFQAMGNGAMAWSDITVLAKSERQALQEIGPFVSSRIELSQEDVDGTTKIVLALHDGAFVESVLLVDAEGRKTACLSSQVGCAMACAFCKTGDIGFKRNLSASEVIEQFLFLNKIHGPIDNIVFMGMGEPLANISNLRRAIAILHDSRGFNFSLRRITISTSGLCLGIRDLADNGPHTRLAISLTSVNEGLRTQLMPINAANPLSELRQALLYYQAKTGDRISLEMVVLGGLSEESMETAKFLEFTSGLNVQINLIPWNKVSGLTFEEPRRHELEALQTRLEASGLNVTRRYRRGKSIQGACGQLGSDCQAAAESRSRISSEP